MKSAGVLLSVAHQQAQLQSMGLPKLTELFHIVYEQTSILPNKPLSYNVFLQNCRVPAKALGCDDDSDSELTVKLMSTIISSYLALLIDDDFAPYVVSGCAQLGVSLRKTPEPEDGRLSTLSPADSVSGSKSTSLSSNQSRLEENVAVEKKRDAASHSANDEQINNPTKRHKVNSDRSSVHDSGDDAYQSADGDLYASSGPDTNPTELEAHVPPKPNRKPKAQSKPAPQSACGPSLPSALDNKPPIKRRKRRTKAEMQAANEAKAAEQALKAAAKAQAAMLPVAAKVVRQRLGQAPSSDPPRRPRGRPKSKHIQLMHTPQQLGSAALITAPAGMASSVTPPKAAIHVRTVPSTKPVILPTPKTFISKDLELIASGQVVKPIPHIHPAPPAPVPAPQAPMSSPAMVHPVPIPSARKEITALTALDLDSLEIKVAPARPREIIGLSSLPVNITLRKSMTVKQLKEFLQLQLNPPIAASVLLFGLATLDDRHTLNDYDMDNSSTILYI